MNSNSFSWQSKSKLTVFLRRLTNFISKAVASENTTLEGSIKEVQNSEATVFVDLKQLISKGLFDVIVWTKKTTKFF